MVATAVVGLVIVNALTVTPSPKLANVTSRTKCVPCAVIAMLEKGCPWVPKAGVTSMIWCELLGSEMMKAESSNADSVFPPLRGDLIVMLRAPYAELVAGVPSTSVASISFAETAVKLWTVMSAG